MEATTNFRDFELIEVQELGIQICDNCGKVYPATDNRCPKCGY